MSSNIARFAALNHTKHLPCRIVSRDNTITGVVRLHGTDSLQGWRSKKPIDFLVKIVIILVVSKTLLFNVVICKKTELFLGTGYIIKHLTNEVIYKLTNSDISLSPIVLRTGEHHS